LLSNRTILSVYAQNPMYANHVSNKIIQDRVKNIPDYLNQNNQLRLINADDYNSDRHYDRKLNISSDDITVNFIDVPDCVDDSFLEELKVKLDVVNNKSFKIINSLLGKDLIDQKEHETFTMMAESLFNQLDTIITTEDNQEKA